MPRGFASGGYSADTGFCRFRARELRKEAGLTLVGLSATIPGMSHSQISEWETGRSRICWATRSDGKTITDEMKHDMLIMRAEVDRIRILREDRVWNGQPWRPVQ